jgi:hypothetical protein
VETQYAGARRVAKWFRGLGWFSLGIAILLIVLLLLGLIIGAPRNFGLLYLGGAVGSLAVVLVFSVLPITTACMWFFFAYVLELLADIASYSFETGKLIFNSTSRVKEK